MTSAERVQLELMRRAAPRERAALALRLSDETIALARRAIARSWPELNEAERRLKLVELLYGAEIARRLAARGIGS
jgi:hypothetical protein